jgi:hypothetical protein
VTFAQVAKLPGTPAKSLRRLARRRARDSPMPALAPSEMGTACKLADDERVPCMGRPALLISIAFSGTGLSRQDFRKFGGCPAKEGPLQEQALHQPGGSRRCRVLGAARADRLTARR